MKRWLFAIGVLAAAGGCRNDNTTVIRDLSMPTPTDGGVPDKAMAVDMASMFMPTTINAIDKGDTPSMSKVAVSGAVVIGVARSDGPTKTSMRCQYSAWIQDPAGPAPSGIKLYVTGQVCTIPDGGTSCRCPFPPMSGTPLDGIALGDKVDVTGQVSVFVPNPTDAGIQPPQHEIVVTSLTKTGTGTVTPTVITDGTMFANNAPGFQMNEGMLITIKPSAPAMTTAPNNFGQYNFAGAYFDDKYSFVYNAGNDGGAYPPAGTTLSSITGIADPSFGGSLQPRIKEDFVP